MGEICPDSQPEIEYVSEVRAPFDLLQMSDSVFNTLQETKLILLINGIREMHRWHFTR